MRVTTWAEYGLIVSIHLAKRSGQGPVAARELSEQERLPHDYVEQILLRLRRAGLVESVRGAQGGGPPGPLGSSGSGTGRRTIMSSSPCCACGARDWSSRSAAPRAAISWRAT